jgi:hypothetical protein
MTAFERTPTELTQRLRPFIEIARGSRAHQARCHLGVIAVPEWIVIALRDVT